MTEQAIPGVASCPPPVPPRRRLPATRKSVTRHTEITWYDRDENGELGEKRASNLYVTVGFYDDGSLAEVFVRIDRVGSIVRETVDAWATALSIGLQHGIDPETFLSKHRGSGAGAKFAEDYFTSDPSIPKCRGPVDYIAKWLGRWVKGEEG